MLDKHINGNNIIRNKNFSILLSNNKTRIETAEV